MPSERAAMFGRGVLILIAFLLTNSDLITVRAVSKFEFLFTNPLDPELYFNGMELICNEGYPVQQHKTITQDGYVLNLHRIPNGNRKERVGPKRRGYTKFHYFVHPDYYACVNESASEKPRGPPVLLQHGFLGASDTWVLQGTERDLAYLLADAGYDVWMSDIRGNYYSRAHLYRNTNSKEFWDFSWHEIGYYDLPALIDYVLKETNHKKLYYVGHSMGTSVFMVLGSTRPEYMKKVRLASLLAPVGNLTTTLTVPPRGPIYQFIRTVLLTEGVKKLPELPPSDFSIGDLKRDSTKKYFPNKGQLKPKPFNSVIVSSETIPVLELEKKQKYEFAARVNWIPLVINRFCNKKSPFQDFCYDVGISVDGHPYYNLVRKTFARAVTHLLSGASTKTFFHFIQILESQKFRYYDYGEEENFKKYHQAEPPEYDLSKVTAPIALLYSDADLFTDAEQVEVLAPLLPNVVFAKKLSRFLHTDFIIARNAKEKVYDDVLALIKKY